MDVLLWGLSCQLSVITFSAHAEAGWKPAARDLHRQKRLCHPALHAGF